MDLLEHVASRIRELRQAYGGGKGLTQEGLAEHLEVASNTISRWETGAYRPSIEDLEKLARFFGVSILTFFPTEKKPANEKVEALLRTARQLKEDDLEELRRYAEFRRGRHRLAHGLSN